MNQEWFDRGEALFGHPCVTHRDNYNASTKLPAAHEISMFGIKGQIWEWDADHFSVLVYMRNHSEKIIHKIPRRDVDVWVGPTGHSLP